MILVAGGTGTTGTHIVRLLRARGAVSYTHLTLPTKA